MARRNVERLDFGAIERLRLGWRILRDPRVPAFPKWIAPGLMAIYVLSPVDAIPDFIPILGQLDDVGVIGVGLAAVALLVKWAPRAIVAEHANAMGFAGGANDEPLRPEDRARAGRARGAADRQKEPIEATYWVDEWR